MKVKFLGDFVECDFRADNLLPFNTLDDEIISKAVNPTAAAAANDARVLMKIRNPADRVVVVAFYVKNRTLNAATFGKLHDSILSDDQKFMARQFIKYKNFLDVNIPMTLDAKIQYDFIKMNKNVDKQKLQVDKREEVLRNVMIDSNHVMETFTG